MRPFPPASELKFLVGLEVEQVCLDPWSIQIRFAEGGRITIEEEFEHVDARKGVHVHHRGDERDVGPVFLRELVQERVTAIEVESFRMTLGFSNGSILRVLSAEGSYECGQILPPDDPERPIIF